MSWIDDLLGYKVFKNTSGNDLPQRSRVRVVGGVEATDDSVLKETVLTVSAGVPSAHAASHAEGAADEVDVTDLAGYPGGTTNYLRADGTFASPTGTGGQYTTRTITTSGTYTVVPGERIVVLCALGTEAVVLNLPAVDPDALGATFELLVLLFQGATCTLQPDAADVFATNMGVDAAFTAGDPYVLAPTESAASWWLACRSFLAPVIGGQWVLDNFTPASIIGVPPVDADTAAPGVNIMTPVGLTNAVETSPARSAGSISAFLGNGGDATGATGDAGGGGGLNVTFGSGGDAAGAGAGGDAGVLALTGGQAGTSIDLGGATPTPWSIVAPAGGDATNGQPAGAGGAMGTQGGQGGSIVGHDVAGGAGGDNWTRGGVGGGSSGDSGGANAGKGGTGGVIGGAGGVGANGSNGGEGGDGVLDGGPAGTGGTPLGPGPVRIAGANARESYHGRNDYSVLHWFYGRVVRENPPTLIDHTDSPYAARPGESIIATTTGGAVVVDLPGDAASLPGTEVRVSSRGGVNNCTINPPSGDTVNGTTSVVLASTRLSRTFESDGVSDWAVVASV